MNCVVPQELDAARVAERNAVLKANLLESELEYYKAPKFIRPQVLPLHAPRVQRVLR